MRMALLVLAVVAASFSFSSPSKVNAAPASVPYQFNNAAIGGGGFITGIVFNESQANLIYARTDIGGAYRWDQPTGSWIPLLDWAGWNNWNYNGVVSIATDPVQPNRVYAAVGMYTNSWDPNNGAILRSSDQGNTWQAAPLPFKLGGNMPGRGMGERLAIDPNNNAVLYFGAPSGQGLWRSTDYGATWSKVTSFPNAGTYIQEPSDTNGYLSDIQGVVWVAFDKTSSSSGQTTKSIYVGVADKANPVYRSTDGGVTWQAVSGAPTGYIPHKGIFEPVNRMLYIATSDTGGPYDGGKGDVWKYNAATGAWTQISPIPSSSSDDYFGYSGLTIDKQHPNTIMVATQVSWWPDINMFRSTDGGATWTKAWDWSSYPNRTFRYSLDITGYPWLTFGANPQPPETTPKLGWMTEAMAIDPFNSNRLMYGTGATLYGTTNLTDWDSGAQMTIKPMVKGLEETAIKDLISPPSGASLISAQGDVGGFRHTDLQTPAMMFVSPVFTSSTSLDYAELNPSVIVRAGDFTDSDRPNDSHAAFSTDGGVNWFQGTEPSGINSGGTIAAAADGSRFVWAPGDPGQSIVYSVGYGNSWTASTGIPANATVESDRVNPMKFYGLKDGTFYVSTNGGASFAAKATGLPTESNYGVKFHLFPGHEGDIWLTAKTGLYRSTDSGTTFAKVAGVAEATNIGFGKAAPGQSYPALYLVGTIDGAQGLFRSDDASATWVRINDDQHQYVNWGEALTGDPRIYGRVYVGTNGRGIIYGDPAGGVTVPSVPTGLTATAGNAQVALSWTASSGATSYTVKRATTSGGPYTNVATGVTATGYTNTGLTNGTAYYYVVSASNSAGESSNSAQASATPTTGTQVPAAPAGLTATAGNAQVALSWTASSGATSYTVKRATTSGGPYTNVATGVTATSYTNTGLTNGTTYYYAVSASNSAGESSNSAQASATPTGGTGTSALVAQYKLNNANATDNMIYATFNIKNTGTTAVNLGDVKLRYYLTKDGSANLSFWCDYAQVGTSAVSGSFVTINPATTGADTYLEISFGSAAGSIAAGGQTGDIQIRIAKSDWSNFNEANDYSFDGTKSAFADWNKVTVYQNGTLAWGIEP